MRRVWWALVAAGAPFGLLTSFEMYFLTLTRGRQNLLFSFTHTVPAWAIAGMAASAGAYLLALLLGVARGVLALRRARALGSRAERASHIVAALLAVHAVLLASYPYWSSLF